MNNKYFIWKHVLNTLYEVRIKERSSSLLTFFFNNLCGQCLYKESKISENDTSDFRLCTSDFVCRERNKSSWRKMYRPRQLNCLGHGSRQLKLQNVDVYMK